MKRILLSLVSAAFVLLAYGAGKKPAKTPAAEFNLATYNIRLPAGSDSVQGNGWGRRLPYIASLVRFHQFDIFGTQEGVVHQLDSLKARLPHYNYIGVGRDDGNRLGEHSAIFYNTEIFELIDHGDFWLSETPDRPSLGWDAAYRRICTWGRFRHIASGREFVHFNLHMDHIGRVARQQSVELIKSKISSLGLEGLPVFLTGDFNIDQNNPCIQSIPASGLFVNSHDVAPLVYEPNGTFNAFDADGYTPSRLDHIFVTPDVEVLKWGVLTDSYRTLPNEMQTPDFSDSYTVNVARYIARCPSDHFPVLIRLRLAR